MMEKYNTSKEVMDLHFEIHKGKAKESECLSVEKEEAKANSLVKEASLNPNSGLAKKTEAMERCSYGERLDKGQLNEQNSNIFNQQTSVSLKPLTKEDLLEEEDVVIGDKCFLNSKVLSAIKLLKQGKLFTNEFNKTKCCKCNKENYIYIKYPHDYKSIHINSKNYCKDCWINYCFRLEEEE